MWPYFWCYSIFITAVSASKVTTTSPDNVADVIKNISRVNDVLQQLIQNYEHLQKIYKSQENLDTPDERVALKEGNQSVTKKDSHNRDNFTPTKIMFSDSEEISDDTSEESTEATTKVTKDASESKNKHKTKRNTKQTTITPVKIHFSLRNARPKLIFIDTHKKIEDEERNTAKRGHDASKKTRFSIQAYGNKKKRNNTGKYTSSFTISDIKKSTKRHDTSKKNQDNTETDKKLGPNHESKTTTITSVKGHNKVTYSFGSKEKRKSNQSNPKFNEKFKSEVLNNDAAIAKNFTNKNMGQIKEAKNVGTEVETNDSSTDLSDNVQDLEMFIEKTNILRKEYGNACLKLVVQKCYKACKKSLTTVCRASKCKSAFKREFDKNSDARCKYLFEDKALRATDTITDSTHGYLTAVCHPAPQSLPIPSNGPVTNATAYERSLLILRTNYEKACVKTSQEKCTDACTFSYTKACEKHKCKSKVVKRFKQECKRHCKAAYKYESAKKDKSSSDSSSDSDSDSESESSS